MTRPETENLRIHVIPLLLAPAAAVALWWVAAEVVPQSSASRLLWVLGATSLPLLAALAWGYRRTRHATHVMLMAVGMVIATVILWWVALVILLVMAGLNCPEDAYECPI